ncbi:leucine-rich melanocyte differentiation-associated protein-like [Brevipalpus obovatus]|uniref:leucine-rich melanocyte differentiation-associated protein-like n=1 Tax=Brevipalpus obovatus TaxID=246614 RepID=UPI003D9F02A6
MANMMKSETRGEDAIIDWEKGQLFYIGKDIESIPCFLCNLYGTRARRLDLSHNQLSSLKGVGNFSELEELVLDNNNLQDSIDFPRCDGLQTLSINKNKLENLENLMNKLSRSYRNLRHLSLLGNPCCPDQLTNRDADEDDYRRYKLFVLYKLPKLKFLDFGKIKNSERREAQRVGPYMGTVRPREDVFDTIDNDNGLATNRYSPLSPPDYSSPAAPKGAYGRLRYRYTGKHSEGNRFIRNSHL